MNNESQSSSDVIGLQSDGCHMLLSVQVVENPLQTK
jgi:hypothetical protein